MSGDGRCGEGCLLLAMLGRPVMRAWRVENLIDNQVRLRHVHANEGMAQSLGNIGLRRLLVITRRSI